ncbi:MAG: hypothetical protein ACI9JO_000995 [Psychrobacter okhotskensis]|jgi:hypothetical protein
MVEKKCYLSPFFIYRHFILLCVKIYKIAATFERIFMKLLPVLPLALAALFAMPQANAIDIKQNNINTCVSGAVKYKVADKSNATKLCNCTIDVRSNMTIGQMWEIESYAQDKKDPSGLPYVKKMQKDLQQCTVGLDLKQPQKPA